MNEQLRGERTPEQAKAEMSAWFESGRPDEVDRAMAHKNAESKQKGI